MSIRNRCGSWLMVAVLGAAVVPGVAWAQRPGGGGHGGRNRAARSAPADAPEAPKLTPEPAQRLDAGAVLCDTEDALQQHQAAVLARLNGTEGREPTGCHLVQSQVAVAVLERHGTSRTEVRLAKPADQVGWTDTMVRR